MKFRTRFIYNSEKNKAYNYGAVQGLRKLGYNVAEVVSADDSCQECKDAEGLVDLFAMTIEDVPGFHPNCTCTVVKPKKPEQE